MSSRESCYRQFAERTATQHAKDPMNNEEIKRLIDVQMAVKDGPRRSERMVEALRAALR
jgi:hypothetical protein